MFNQVWLTILAVMIGGSILKYVFPNPWVAVAIDLAIFAVAFFILRRYPYVNLKRSMSFFAGLTIISIAVDIGILDGLFGNIALLILVGWLLFGQQKNGRSRPPKLRHPWHK